MSFDVVAHVLLLFLAMLVKNMFFFLKKKDWLIVWSLPW